MNLYGAQMVQNLGNFGVTITTSIPYQAGGAAHASSLLLETGDYLLLETGDTLLTE